MLENRVSATLSCQNNDPDPTDELDGTLYPTTVFGLRSGKTCADPSF